MAKMTKKKNLIFAAIRKPIAPPSQKLSTDKIEEKVHPAKRKIKHKKKEDTNDG
jgi:hypothetical protein